MNSERSYFKYLTYSLALVVMLVVGEQSYAYVDPVAGGGDEHVLWSLGSQWTDDQASPLVLISQSSSRRRQSRAQGRRVNRVNNNVVDTTSAAPRSAARSKKRAKNRSSILRTEKTYNIRGGNKSTVIDFDETDITGERRDPGVGFVQSTFSERKSDFVKIRREWHYAMIQSTQLVD